MCCNKETSGCLPWDASWDFEFERMKAWDNTKPSKEMNH